ncbi:MAG: phage tail tip lysozyme [Peptoniphilus sp.]|nr:phage tail tip lysozyme [Peptoniphilus sp.]MDY6045250.1 phage tail tip lysozyme [Peptoniphilus sp.]
MKLYVSGKDVSQFYDAATWSGGDGQAGRKLEFNLATSQNPHTDKNLPTIVTKMNDSVRLTKDDGTVVFDGELVSKEKSISGRLMRVTAMDKLYRVNATQKTYNFKDKKPDEIAGQVFKDLEIPTGKLDTGAPITRVFDMTSAYQIVMTAYHLEYEKSKKPFIVRMDGEKVECVERGKTVAKYMLDPSFNLIDSRFSVSVKDAVEKVDKYDSDGNKIGTIGGTKVPKGADNEEKIWNYFKDLGYSDAATAGILGNLYQESRFDPSCKQYGGGPGRGLAQWGGSRLAELRSFAKSQGKSSTDLGVQLAFIDKEMREGKNVYWKRAKMSYAEFKKISDPVAGVRAFERAFERAGSPKYGIRERKAKEIYGRRKGTGPKGATKVYRQEKHEDAKARAEGILKEIEKKADLKVFGDYDLITGNAVIVREPFTGLNGKFFIVSDTHHFANNYHEVELTLSYQNLMEDVNTSENKPEATEESVTSDGMGSGGPPPSGLAGSLIQNSKKYVGIPYVWGGKSRRGTDCSGFVQFVYQDAGIDFCPGRLTSSKMASQYKQYGFQRIPVKQAQPGDVMWNSGHVAMMYDDKNVIEASQSKGKVVIQTAFHRYTPFTWAYRYVGR